ncbi:MAG: peptidoglycan DD-metalloendopeptidase family protein [Elusimicrobiota bacterium]|nr:peptidoglycan DD-metalloendopeptidase family protein [Elusimicrobiota bacterium]
MKNFLIIILFAAGCTYIGPGIYHTVSEGETIWSLSRTYGVDSDKLVRANSRIDDPRQIKPGQKVYIPGASRQVHGEKKDARPDTAFIWPLRGEIIRKFGAQGHKRSLGIGIKAPESTPVVAAADGQVIFESDNFRSYGKIIIIEHEGGYATVYAHNSENNVKVGDAVKKEDVIALSGSSGRADEPLLYFEIRYREKARNPIYFLP